MKIFGLLTTVLGVALAGSAWSQTVRPGLWEYTIDTLRPAMTDEDEAEQAPPLPSSLGPPAGVQAPTGLQIPPLSQAPDGGIRVVETRCVTGDTPIPSDPQRDRGCTTGRMTSSGNKVAWTVTCRTPETTLSGEGEATYTGDRVDSTLTLRGPMETAPVSTTRHTTGRYLGPCKP